MKTFFLTLIVGFGLFVGTGYFENFQDLPTITILLDHGADI